MKTCVANFYIQWVTSQCRLLEFAMVPLYMTDIVSFSKNDHYSLRSVKHNDLVPKKKPNTQFFKDSFSYYSLSMWNEIPSNIRNYPSIQSFKSLYRNFLFNKNWLFVLQIYMFSLLLDLWIYVSVCRFNICIYFIFYLLYFMTLTCMHQIRDG